MSTLNENIRLLTEQQLATWETARRNYEALAHVQLKEVDVRGVRYRVQFNPARIVSSAARVDDRSLRERRCFLCPANRPAEQQGIPFRGHYQLLLNPFPIFPRHLTIVEDEHTPQRIATRVDDMLELARLLTDYTVFYNGPRCGASAPDHAHFQAGSRGFMPIESQWRTLGQTLIDTCGTARLLRLDDAPRHTLVITSPSATDAAQLFRHVYDALPVAPGEDEPMLNLLALYEPAGWTLFVFPRRKHRPSCYFAEGDARLLCSPASVDLGGVFILPREEDFLRIGSHEIEEMLNEVCWEGTL